MNLWRCRGLLGDHVHLFWAWAWATRARLYIRLAWALLRAGFYLARGKWYRWRAGV